MARKARIHVPGGVYHVMMLGNGGQDIFFADHDRYRLYLLIQEGTIRFDYRVHAFCLMGNHIHLNPVRAGLVKQADYYPFSSHRSYLGYAPLPWLTTDWILRQFDRSVMKAPMVGKAYGLSVLELKAAGRSRQAAEARALVGLIVVQLSIDTLTAAASYFGRDVSTLSTGIKRLTIKIRQADVAYQPCSSILEQFDIKL